MAGQQQKMEGETGNQVPPTGAASGSRHRAYSWGDMINPFASLSTLKRSPTQGAKKAVALSSRDPIETHSSPELSGAKRKRKGSDDLIWIESVIAKMTARIKELDSLVRINTNTKREIKDVTEILKRLGERLEPARVRQIFDDVREDLDITKFPKQQTVGDFKEMSTQTEAWVTSKPKTVVAADIVSCAGNCSKWQDIAKLKWEDTVFANSEIKVGNPLSTSREVVKCVLVDPADPKMDLGIQRLYRDRFPELMESAGSFEVLEQQTRRRTAEGQETTKQKVLLVRHDNSLPDLWEKITRVKEEISGQGQLALHYIAAVDTEVLKKMVQAIFQGTETKVRIYTTQREREEKKKNKKPKAARVERDTVALTVEGSGKSYREVLKDVRKAVADKAVSEEIRAIRSTREDKLLIVLNKNEQAKEEIRKLIESSSLKVNKVGRRDKMETIHLRGLDALTTKEEVERAVNAVTQGAKVGDLRPNVRNTQAVTVVLSKPEADKLLKEKTLRVGPVRCDVEKRLRVAQCSKCWSYDHKTAKCGGPDRRKLCRKCGCSAHVGKPCEERIKCLLCNGAEHQTGTGRCKAFATALARVKADNSRRKEVPPKRQSAEDAQ